MKKALALFAWQLTVTILVIYSVSALCYALGHLTIAALERLP
jgi:hypothetical protein